MNALKWILEELRLIYQAKIIALEFHFRMSNTYSGFSGVSTCRILLADSVRCCRHVGGGGKRDGGIPAGQCSDCVSLVHRRVVGSQLSFGLTSLSARSAVKIECTVVLKKETLWNWVIIDINENKFIFRYSHVIKFITIWSRCLRLDLEFIIGKLENGFQCWTSNLNKRPRFRDSRII